MMPSTLSGAKQRSIAGCSSASGAGPAGRRNRRGARRPAALLRRLPGQADQRLGQRTEPLARHVMRDEAAIERIRGLEARPGEAEIAADPAGAAIEEQLSRRYPGKRPIAVSGMAKSEPLGRDAVRAVQRDAGAAAHGDAVEQRDIGFGKAVDALDQAIFLAEEIGGEPGRAPLPRLVDRPDVAAGAERARRRRRGSRRHGRRDRAPSATRSGSSVRYMPRVSVLSAFGRFSVTSATPPFRSRRISSVLLGWVSGMVLRTDCWPGRYWPSSRRAMMTRMISFVPSRI